MFLKTHFEAVNVEFSPIASTASLSALHASDHASHFQSRRADAYSVSIFHAANDSGAATLGVAIIIVETD
jgi:hypothetical protein